MRISKKKHLLDEQSVSPKQLFDTLTSMSRNISPHSRIQLFSHRLQRKQDCIGNEDQQGRDENHDFDDARNKKMHGLKKIIQQQKIKSIVRHFITKIKRNNVNSKPVIYEPFQSQQKRFIQRQGLQLPQFIDSILSITNILQVSVLTFLFTLSLVFGDILNSAFGTFFLNFSIVFYTLEFILNLITVKSMEGRKITVIIEIIQRYAKERMIPDALSILILIIDVSSNWDEMIYLRMILLLKISTCLDKLQKLENKVLDTFYKEQYWGLIKVFLFNFIFAHFLAICLVAMSKLDLQHNWIQSKAQVLTSNWFEIYIWAFYWATTIMLTVGFGDFSATNYKQALCLVFIQTVSCIVLAYNINCVGILINNIRSQDIEKNKNFKIFKKLSEKNDIPEQLNWRINNYIEQSSNIKKNFNFAQENQFICKLPISLKADFLKQSNKKIFQNLIFFRNLTEKTLLNFAEKIQMKICHPEEYVKRKEDQNDLIILKQGHLGYFCRRNTSDYYDTLIDELIVEQKQNPLLLSLDFISKDKTVYQMKSLQYSILFHLNYNSTITMLRSGELDYEHYCQLRDKSRHIVDQYQIFNCEICNGHHTKFTCPKLHYVPLQQHIIIKNLHKIKHEKATRLKFQRKKLPFSVLRMQKIDRNNHIKELSEQQSVQKLRRTGKFLPGTLPTQVMQTFQQASQKSINQPSANDRNFVKMKNLIQVTKKDIIIALQPHFQQHLWLLQSDMVHNFKFYFNQNNSSNLQNIRFKK